MKPISDVAVYFTLGILLAFLRTNFDPNLAGVFFTFLVITFLYYVWDKHHSITIESKPDRVKSVMYAVIGYVAVIGLSALVNGVGFFSILEVMAETQASLAFAESLVLTFVAFVVLIPTIETPFIGMVIEFLKDTFNLDMSKLNWKLILVFFIVSTGFMYLHISAKGVTNTDALVTVFIFAMVTCYLIFLEKQMLAAILMHIIANGVALSISYGWFETISTSMFVGIGAVVLVVYLLKNIRVNARGFKLFGG